MKRIKLGTAALWLCIPLSLALLVFVGVSSAKRDIEEASGHEFQAKATEDAPVKKDPAILGQLELPSESRMVEQSLSGRYLLFALVPGSEDAKGKRAASELQLVDIEKRAVVKKAPLDFVPSLIKLNDTFALIGEERVRKIHVIKLRDLKESKVLAHNLQKDQAGFVTEEMFYIKDEGERLYDARDWSVMREGRLAEAIEARQDHTRINRYFPSVSGIPRNFGENYLFGGFLFDSKTHKVVSDIVEYDERKRQLLAGPWNRRAEFAKSLESPAGFTRVASENAIALLKDQPLGVSIELGALLQVDLFFFEIRGGSKVHTMNLKPPMEADSRDLYRHNPFGNSQIQPNKEVRYYGSTIAARMGAVLYFVKMPTLEPKLAQAPLGFEFNEGLLHVSKASAAKLRVPINLFGDFDGLDLELEKAPTGIELDASARMIEIDRDAVLSLTEDYFASLARGGEQWVSLGRAEWDNASSYVEAYMEGNAPYYAFVFGKAPPSPTSAFSFSLHARNGFGEETKRQFRVFVSIDEKLATARMDEGLKREAGIAAANKARSSEKRRVQQIYRRVLAEKAAEEAAEKR